LVDDALFLAGLSPVAGKPVHLAFDGGRLNSLAEPEAFQQYLQIFEMQIEL